MHRPLACLATLALLAPAASAATIGATVVDASSGDYTLTSVSVTRGSAGTFTYEPFQLTNVTLADVDANDIPLLVSRGAPVPAPGQRAALLEDDRLDTGIINITTTNGAADRSVKVTFGSPVVNSTGEDILFFNVGSDDGIRFWTGDNSEDKTNRGANLGINRHSGNLLSSVPFTQYRYRNGTEANVLSLADLETTENRYSAFAGGDSSSTINVLGLDLSAIGVPLGGAVDSIRFQSLTNDPGAGGRLDPVLIVGLPAVPEPASLAAVALGAGVLIRRRRA